MPGFRVTYEIVTPESAENGEADEGGFVMPGDGRDDIETALKEPPGTYDMSLREVMRLAYPQHDCGRWWSEEGEDRMDYATGAVETRAIHPPRNITRASYRRVTRLLGLRVGPYCGA